MGTYLSAPKTEKVTLLKENESFLVASSEMQGWRTSMEDAKIVHLAPDGTTALLGIFDGHGGKDVANYVSESILQLLLENENYQSGAIEEALAEVYLEIDRRLYTPDGLIRVKALSGNPEPIEVVMNSGCTAVTALIQKDWLYVANAGDSRCVVAKGGIACPMSVDHKPDLPEELNRIERARGCVEEGRVMGNLNLSRSLGDLRYKQNMELDPKEQMITGLPDVRKMQIAEDVDFIVLACDGVWDIFSSEACVNFIYERLGEKPLGTIIEELLQKCLAKDVQSSGGLGCDNTTCIVLVFKHPT